MQRRRLPPAAVVLALFGPGVAAAGAPASAGGRDWTFYGADAGGSRYSSLAEIDRTNVGALEPAWRIRTGDLDALPPPPAHMAFQATPIRVGELLVLPTPLGRVLALDPASGEERWRFDATVAGEEYPEYSSRGVAAWTDRERAVSDACARRVFAATVDSRLFALDAATGLRCGEFGRGGVVDLREGVGPLLPWDYATSSPPAVAGDLVVVGSAIGDNQRVEAPRGVVRAYDARSGALRWSWDPIPRDADDPAHAGWDPVAAERVGAANAWAPLSVDAERDLLFVPTSSPSPDYYGGERPGDDRYANSVVALRASTGRVVWHFQVVHHDLWDYDVPAQPTLASVRRGGREVPVVIQPTKMGHLFFLDRETGQPIFPVEERAVPASDVPGEVASPTQPFPPPALRLAPESLSAAEAYGVTDSMRARCRARIASLRFRGVFTPPSLQGTIIWPGNIGGMNWSGVSVDERRGILVAPTNQLATVVHLIPRDSLRAAILAQPDLEYGRQRGTPYGMSRSDLRICTPPPWGTLTAVDLNLGTVKWRVPLGSFPQLAQAPGAAGSVQLGGALLTGSGLVFIAGTFDQHLRAIDIGTGAELWSAPLPAAGHALPMSYSVDGRQYVVIAAGGHDRLHTRTGDYVLAYTLPGRGAPTPDATPGALSGKWEGEMHIGDAAFGMGLTLDIAGDSVTAIVRLDSVLVGPVTAQRSGRGVTVSFPLSYPGKGGCSATIRTTVELWNGGQLLEGGGTFDGACASNGHQEAAFVFRRASAAPSLIIVPQGSMLRRSLLEDRGTEVALGLCGDIALHEAGCTARTRRRSSGTATGALGEPDGGGPRPGHGWPAESSDGRSDQRQG